MYNQPILHFFTHFIADSRFKLSSVKFNGFQANGYELKDLVMLS